jgi:hypothetical protein
MLSLEVLFVLGGLFGFLLSAIVRTRVTGERLPSLSSVDDTRGGQL